jgi:hypothetical protein
MSDSDAPRDQHDIQSETEPAVQTAGHVPGDEEQPLSEEELRAAYEAELKRLRVDDVLVQTVVSLLNLAARRAGLTGAGEDEIDFAQVGQAIEATRALLPLVEPVLGPDVKQVRDALSQLQIAYARSGAAPPAGEGEPAAAGQPASTGQAGTGPAQSSGRLWVPGQ